MVWESYYPYMASGMYSTVLDGKFCAGNNRITNRDGMLCLLSLTGPLEFAAIDILSPLLNTKKGN